LQLCLQWVTLLIKERVKQVPLDKFSLWAKRENTMTKLMGIVAATGLALSAMVGTASAASMGEMMQCSAQCSKDMMQCVMSANQLAGTPAEGLSQIKSNVMGSTECGKASMACQASCR